MRHLIPFVQYKKCEKHLWRSVTFSKVADGNKSRKVPLFKISVGRVNKFILKIFRLNKLRYISKLP